MTEEWRSITGYENLYEVSNLGRVRRNSGKVKTKSGSLRTVSSTIKVPQSVPKSSYRYITLSKHNKSKSFNICFLVAREFLEGFNIEGPIYHINGDDSDDSVSNLTQKVPSNFNRYIGLDYTALDPNEIWKPVPNFEDLYEVSNLGRIKVLAKYIRNPRGYYSLRKCKLVEFNRPLKGYQKYYTYRFVNASNYSEEWQIHRLVATVFVHNDSPNRCTCVNHIDYNTTNNRSTNLEWVTPKQNAAHASMNGLLSWSNTCRHHTTKVICTSDNMCFESIADAARFYNIKYSRLQEKLRFGNGVINGLEFRRLTK